MPGQGLPCSLAPFLRPSSLKAQDTLTRIGESQLNSHIYESSSHPLSISLQLEAVVPRGAYRIVTSVLQRRM
jgi:hypothetical protein